MHLHAILAIALLLCASPRASAGSWQTRATNGSPNKRHEAAFVMGDGGKAYLVGGRRVQPVNILDTNTGTWSNGKAPPQEIHHFQAVFRNGYIWIPSSWTGPYPYEKNVDKFYAYNTKTNTWETRTPMPSDRRRGGAAVVFHNNRLYVGGGNRGGHGSHATSLGWLDWYDFGTGAWSQGPSFSSPRDHTGGAVVNNQFCIAGGRDGGHANFFWKNVAQTVCFDFASGSWQVKADIPSPRAGSSYGRTCDGKLVVAGGEGFGKAFNRVDVFNGFGWESGGSLVQARHGSGVAVSGNCQSKTMFVASGSGAQGSPELTSTEMYEDCESD